VYIAGIFTHVFRHAGGKGDNIVPGNLLNLINPLDVKARFFFNILQRRFRNQAQGTERFAGRNLNRKPLLKAVLGRPDFFHYVACVAVYHGSTPAESQKQSAFSVRK
jgi:hypothetical protein